MSVRPVRGAVAVVLAVGASWFVTSRAAGADARSHAPQPDEAVEWSATVGDGPWQLASDRWGVVVTTSQRSVWAFTPAGRRVWRRSVDDLVTGRAAVSHELVLVGGERSVTALERRGGRERWRSPTAGRAYSLALAGEVALVGDSSGVVAALDVGSGVPRWSVRFPGSPFSAARVDAASGAVVVTWHQSTANAVRVLDLASGAVRWSAPIGRFSAAPLLADGRVVLASGDGNHHADVEARSLGSGDSTWRTAVPAPFEEAIEPAADASGIVTVDHFGVVTALDHQRGSVRWQRDLAAAVLETRVVLAADRVVLTTYAGDLFVLDRDDGRVVARLGTGRLGGLPVSTAAAPGPNRRRILVALRLRDWGIQLRRLP